MDRGQRRGHPLLATEHGACAHAGCPVDVREAHPRPAGDLPRAGLPAQLPHYLVHLPQSGGADGLPVRQAAAVGVDRQPAADLRRPAGDQLSCSPCWHRPVSARCITSAPDSVSWTWATSTSAGPMPAASNAAAAATAVDDGAGSIAIDGLKTSNEPNERVRSATDRSSTGGREEPRSRAPRASTSAAAPSPGEQNMNWVSG